MQEAEDSCRTLPFALASFISEANAIAFDRTMQEQERSGSDVGSQPEWAMDFLVDGLAPGRLCLSSASWMRTRASARTLIAETVLGSRLVTRVLSN
jgi:hypothetical protein